MSDAKELREYIEKMVAAGLSRDGMLTRAADALAAKDAQIAALTAENERLRALKVYPKSYAIRYATGFVEVYAEPALPAPRGRISRAHVIGIDNRNYGAAWADAVRRLKEQK